MNTLPPDIPEDHEIDAGRRPGKSDSAFRTISEVSADLGVPQHVLRFWETKFSQIRPMKRGGGRRYYRPEDVVLLAAIRDLLYNDGYTIRGAQKLLREQGLRAVLAQVGEGRDRPTLVGPTILGLEDEDDFEPRPDPAPVPPEERGDDEEHEEHEESQEHEEHQEEEIDDETPLENVEDEALPPVVLPPPPEPEQPAPIKAAGLTDDQRQDLEDILQELEDLRRILFQAGI